MRKAYIAVYPLSESGNDLDEVIVAQAEYWTPKLDAIFDWLVEDRDPAHPMVQGWYADDPIVECMATTNQPYLLD